MPLFENLLTDLGEEKVWRLWPIRGGKKGEKKHLLYHILQS